MQSSHKGPAVYIYIYVCVCTFSVFWDRDVWSLVRMVWCSLPTGAPVLSTGEGGERNMHRGHGLKRNSVQEGAACLVHSGCLLVQADTPCWLFPCLGTALSVLWGRPWKRCVCSLRETMRMTCLFSEGDDENDMTVLWGRRREWHVCSLRETMRLACLFSEGGHKNSVSVLWGRRREWHVCSLRETMRLACLFSEGGHKNSVSVLWGRAWEQCTCSLRETQSPWEQCVCSLRETMRTAWVWSFVTWPLLHASWSLSGHRLQCVSRVWWK